MRASGMIERCAWPEARLGEGVEALARAARLQPRDGRMSSFPETSANGRTNAWAERLGDCLGLEIEPVAFRGDEAEMLVRGAAPAVLPIGGGRLMLVRAGRRRAVLLAPDGALRRVRVGAIASAVSRSRGEGAEGLQDLERGLAAAGLDREERARVRARLERDDRERRTNGCWLVRPPAGAPWRAAARSVRLCRRLAFLLAAKGSEQIAWVLSWWLIGRAALEGRFEVGWLAAWVLLLACTIPIQAATLRAAGRLAVDLGAQIRRRLMAGALRMPPDALRKEGVGQSLGRVLESDALETLALGGGFVALLAAVEIAVAMAVLAAGASPIAQVAALLVWIALAGFLARRYVAARRPWTDQRLFLTHDLVESMVGHSTRLVQQTPDRLHQDEDRGLEAYLASSRAMDRAMVVLTALIPRGWVVIGVLTAAPAFFAGASTPSLAISLGGVLLAYRALRQMVEGLVDVSAAVVAWERVEPILRAAERGEAPADPALLSFEGVEPAASVPALSARDLSFRHAGRHEAVLDACDLDVRSGDKLVLEGRSGSGKSTLASLLTGLRSPDAGLLLAGGLDRHTLGGSGWRGRVVASPQFHENHVFGGTLLFNLLMGRSWPPSDADARDAERMCRRLGLGPLLDRMPAGILQMVGETGWRLAHGERARVWIARALLQGADTVVIDEGLDALDPETLHRVLQVLREEKAAVLVIAHP